MARLCDKLFSVVLLFAALACALAQAGPTPVKPLAGHGTLPTPDRIAELIESLGDQEFSRRERAQDELERIGLAAFDALHQVLQQTEIYEKSGQRGFLIQEYIPNEYKTLRVVKIGRQLISYWRVLNTQNGFLANLSKGATIDFDSDPDLQSKATVTTNTLCIKSGINLAGFDVIFSSEENDGPPLMLEINYFFGRKGLGGSDAYYEILQREIRQWLNSLGLSQKPMAV